MGVNGQEPADRGPVHTCNFSCSRSLENRSMDPSGLEPATSRLTGQRHSTQGTTTGGEEDFGRPLPAVVEGFADPALIPHEQP
jgi:hypothetical protein